MTYELRNPQANDLFVVAKIIKVVGIKNIVNCFSNKIEEFKATNAERETPTTEAEQFELGVGVMGDIGELIFEKLDLVQDDVYKFMANLSGLSIDEIACMDIVEFAEMFMDIIKNPKFADFIRVVLKSFK